MESSELDLKKYLNLLYRTRVVFICTALLIMTAAFVVSYVLPKQYEAKSTVFIERNVINELIKDIAVTPSMGDRLKVLSYAITSRNILTKVANELGVNLEGAAFDSFIAELQKDTTVKMKDMDLFVVSYRGEDPKFASDYINTLVRLYIEENVSSKREEAYGANRFLSEQIKFFKEKLDAVEGDVINFRKEKGVFVAVSETGIVEEIKKAQDELDAIKIQKREVEARRATIKKQLAEEKPYTVAMYSRGSLSDRMAVLQKRMNELSTTYTKDYPEVIKVRAEIESLKQMAKEKPAAEEVPEDSSSEMSTLNPIYQQLREESTKSERELAALSAKEEHLRGRLGSKQSYLRNIPAEKTKLSELEMERNTYKRIYEELVARLGQSEVSKQMEVQDKTATFRIVDPAMVANAPISPNRVNIMLLGLIAGLAGGAGVVFGLDFLNKSAKGVGALKDFGIPVLAVIPIIKDTQEMIRARKKDVLTYSIAGAYLAFLVALVALEIFGFSVVDKLLGAA
jgi:polysaccharide chain length determinant protein (PEP-CTERM system associated)